MSFVSTNIILEFEIPVKSFLVLPLKYLLPYCEPSQQFMQLFKGEYHD